MRGEIGLPRLSPSNFSPACTFRARLLCASAATASLYQCHGGCRANERGLSLEREGLGYAIHSAYLNAL